MQTSIRLLLRRIDYQVQEKLTTYSFKILIGSLNRLLRLAREDGYLQSTTSINLNLTLPSGRAMIAKEDRTSKTRILMHISLVPQKFIELITTKHWEHTEQKMQQ